MIRRAPAKPARAATTRARYYHVARLAHLERLDDDELDFLYCEHRADWDEAFARGRPNVHQLNFIALLKRVWRSDYEVLEIPEPLAIVLLPKLLAIVVLTGVKNLGRRTPMRLVTYAIENLDQAVKVSAVSGISTPLARAILRFPLRFVYARISRIAFGTSGSKDCYNAAIGARWMESRIQPQVKTFLALPSPASVKHPKSQFAVCFVGALDDRKGIKNLIEAWPAVAIAHPLAKLNVLGHGPLENMVREFVSSREDAELLVDPPRELIWGALRRSKCLVLPSQRTAKWREQVGLPILEGLANGCEVVTTRETGIADWLVENGHQVIDDPLSAEQLSLAIGRAISSERGSQEILDSLPSTDSRESAETWMFQTDVNRDGDDL